MQILHHGAVNGVTGSCHELVINPQTSILIDCGLFQGEEYPSGDHRTDTDIPTIKGLTAITKTYQHAVLQR